MKNILILLMCLFTQAALADFIDATEAYNNKEYQHAYADFKALALLGNKRAQFNIAVMHLNGEYVEQDMIKAYAWGKLAEHPDHPDFAQIRIKLSKSFSEQELSQAEQAYDVLNAEYGDAQIHTKLSPIEYVADNDSDSSSEFTIHPIERKAPRYPMKEVRYGTQGWVRVEFEVFPDGSTRNPVVIESVPEGAFDEVTIEAIQGFKFKVAFKDNVNPYPVTAQQLIQYKLPIKDKKSVAEMYQERLQKLKVQAENGHPTAQYYYALAASSQSMVSDFVDIEPVAANQWLLKSAQNGNLDAQYQLGYNILTGKGCQVEKQKGVDWIVHAAEQGHAKSARQAYRQLTKLNFLNNTEKPPHYWLKKAADNGDPEAQLDYAQFLAETADTNSISTARSYLKSYLKERDKNVKYHQTIAQLYRLENNESKAIKAQKKAEKLAKKLGWEI
ncbi:MAG: TonB family protein [Marinicella sp.]